ncbi:hypothetical protein IQ238_17075 [Pleurocapsales cyanobacterium LEGE 06147]|nr:hypothetical protein [Pleurocapsales cyanobacterium LEGE 06147]
MSDFSAKLYQRSHHEYDLSLAAVYAAMTYYYDHKEEIDRHTAESRARVEQKFSERHQASLVFFNL